MATFNYLFITVLAAMFIPATTSSKYSCSSNMIPLADIHAAVDASFAAYDTSINNGDRIGRYTVSGVYSTTYRTQTIHVKILDLEAESTTMIAFQGTKTNVQLLQYAQDYIVNLVKGKKAMTLHGKEVRVDRNGKQVNTGGYQVEVLDYFMSGMDALLRKMRNHLSKQNRKYIFTGHSLGAAMASTLALHRRLYLGYEWLHPGSCLITFGQPRVGNEAYAVFHDAQISPHRKLRFIYKHDMIPHLPPRPAPSIFFPPLDRPGFLHHSREIYVGWFFGLNFWKFCDFGDPKFHWSKCSNDDWFNFDPFNDHNAYQYMIKKIPGRYIWFNYGDRATTSWEKAWHEACDH